MNKDNILWWSHGGELHGESPAKIKFLKKIMDETPAPGLKPWEKCGSDEVAAAVDKNWDSVCLHDGEEFFLYYYGFSRPMYRNYVLPEGKKYKLELIDTWNMTVEELPEVYEGKIRIRMGARQYMEVRMKE